jgi:hypothetical protein
MPNARYKFLFCHAFSPGKFAENPLIVGAIRLCDKMSHFLLTGFCWVVDCPPLRGTGYRQIVRRQPDWTWTGKTIQPVPSTTTTNQKR